MRILLTNHSLQFVGGTEKWTHAMALEMMRRGHEVEVFCLVGGMTSSMMLSEGITVRMTMGSGYDLAMINHNTCLGMANRIDCPKIYTTHGPLNPLEMPAGGADAYVGVSEELKHWYKQFLDRDLTVITNGVDLEKFYPKEPDKESYISIHGYDQLDTNKSGPRVLSMCKIPLAGAMVAEACRLQHLPFEGIHYISNPVWDTAELIQRHDIVVGVGRTAVEALACGKYVIAFDARAETGVQADGVLTPENIDLCRERNISTRTFKEQWTVEDIEKALYLYKKDDWGRAWAERNADIKDKAQQYLDLAEEISHGVDRAQEDHIPTP